MTFVNRVMAEGDDISSDPFRTITKTIKESDESESDEQETLNVQVNLQRSIEKNKVFVENFTSSGAGSSDLPKREDNPFSFKHFLRSDATNYQNQGARPKVYCNGRPISSISDLDLKHSSESKQTRIIPEFSSALPDFVQDHLVIEQCYLGKDASQNNYNLDIKNLPDFAPSRSSLNINHLNSDSSPNLTRRTESSVSDVPLDLPIRPSVGFPLDLPIGNQHSGSRSCPSSSEVGVSKSLPDFLADGAAHTSENVSIIQSPEREIEQLRQELEISRRQLIEQNRRADHLHRELEAARNKEHEYTQNLVKALEQVEESLERSNKRAACAESTVTKLRQEIKLLNNEVGRLRQQNSMLQSEEGAAGGITFASSNELQSQRLAQELRSAANTAEHSLRQLLTGVDNIRIMAASLENMHRIEERTDKFLDLDDGAGPAL